ncbi:MAG: TolC family outer membrane protein [Pseudomonadota bacterium]
MPPIKANKLSVSLAMVALGLGSSVGAADTLRDVVREALDTNPELAAIRYNRQAIDQELRAARGLGLPTVDVKAEAGRHRDSLKNRLGVSTTDDWHSHRDVSLSVSQRLFDGFERDHEVARQKNRVESARWRVADTANSIALKAVQAYFEVQRAEAVLEAARSNLASLRQLRSRVLRRVNSGLDNAAEETEAGSRVAQATAILAEAEGRLQDARALFKAVVGRMPGKLAPAAVPRAALPPTLSQAVAAARIAAPSVIATQHDATAAAATIGSAYSRLYPKLNLEVSTYHGKGIDEAGDRDLDARAMLVVRWNLFNGGINRARIHEAYARANEATEISANTERVVERETRVSWNAIQSADVRVPSLRRQLQLARQTRSTYSEQFSVGARRLLDLLDAQSEVFVADAALRTEEFVRRFNTLRVLAAMGRIVEALEVAYPEEAVEPHEHWRIESWKAYVHRTPDDGAK